MVQSTFPGKLEVALGADRSANAFGLSWTDWSSRADPAVTVSGGAKSERATADSATLTVRLDNGDGELTPRNAESSIYPNWKRGTPLRYSVAAGSPHLLTTGVSGSQISTPDAASLDIVGDNWGAVEVWAPAGTPPTGFNYQIAGKYLNAGNQRSIVLFTDDAGLLRLRWSTDGTAAGEANAQSSINMPRPSAGIFSFGWFIDVNVGGTSHTVTFYAARMSKAALRAAIIAGDTSVQLGDVFIGSGTTSIFASTAVLGVGDVPGSGFLPYPGQIRSFEWRSGDWTGTVAANPDLTIQTVGAGSFVDTAAVPKTWTVAGGAAITKQQIQFVGEVNAVYPKWPAAAATGTAEVEVAASGILRRLRQGEEPQNSALYRTITSPRNAAALRAYWPLEDGRDALVASSPVDGVGPMGVGSGPPDPNPGNVRFAADSTLSSSKPLPNVSAGSGIGWFGAIPVTGIQPPDWQVTWFMKFPEAPASQFTCMLADSTGSAHTWLVALNSSNVVVAASDAAGASLLLTNATAADSRFYGVWTMWVLDLTQNGGNIDWAVKIIPIPLGSVFGGSGSIAGTIGEPSFLRELQPAPTGGLSFGHFIVTSGKNIGWLAPADTGYVGETAAARIRRLCGEEAIPIAVHGTDAESAAMGPQLPIAFTALLEECADADMGILSEQRHQLGFHYRTRASMYSQAAQWTIDALINPFDPAEDDKDVANDITVTRTNGSSAREVNQALIDGEGRFPKSHDVNIESDGELQSHAAWMLHQGTWPEMRYRQLTVELAKDPSLVDGWLSTAVGDLVHVDNLPAEHPTSSIDQLMIGYTAPNDEFFWTPELVTIPAGPFNVGVLDSAVTRLDTAGSVLHTLVDDNDTTFDVATTVPPLWTTDAAEFPFDARLAGEEVTVTDIDAEVITFGATGTASHAVNASVTPGIPASVAAGNLLLVLAAIRNSGTGIPDTPAGYVRLPAFPATSNVQLFAKIAVGGDTAPTITFTGGVANADTSAQMCRVAGKFHDPANLTAGSYSLILPSAQDIATPALLIGDADIDNCIVLYLGWKADDWTSVATIGGATEIGEPDTTTGDDQGLVWDYVIQTAATNIAAASFVVTGGAAAIARSAVIALRCDRQTWTVTRSTNGVVKGHAAGTAVNVADPFVLAL